MQWNGARGVSGAWQIGRVTIERSEFGREGEVLAERWLRRRGWRVLHRRFRSGHRDIDLVAERDGTVAFVEVKARKRCLDAETLEGLGLPEQPQGLNQDTFGRETLDTG